jgi:hypothetical protein
MTETVVPAKRTRLPNETSLPVFSEIDENFETNLWRYSGRNRFLRDEPVLGSNFHVSPILKRFHTNFAPETVSYN